MYWPGDWLTLHGSFDVMIVEGQKRVTEAFNILFRMALWSQTTV